MSSTPNGPPVAIAAKSWRSCAVSAAGDRCALDHQAGEQLVRQQAGVLGEQAEEQPDQEVGDGVGVLAVLAQQGRQPGELRGGLLRHLLRGLRRRAAPPGR